MLATITPITSISRNPGLQGDILGDKQTLSLDIINSQMEASILSSHQIRKSNPELSDNPALSKSDTDAISAGLSLFKIVLILKYQRIHVKNLILDLH